jgi:hypothetical protein
MLLGQGNSHMNTSLTQVYTFVLVLIGIMAGMAFIMSQRQGQRLGNSVVESFIWGASLIACAGGDYLLIMLNSNSALA